MKKLLVLVLIIVVTLAFGVVAQAAVQTFYGFSIDVPTDWTTNADEGEFSVSFTAPNRLESLKIKYVSKEGMDSCSFAQSIAHELNGSSPLEINGGEFEFALTDGTKIRTIHAESWGVTMKFEDGFAQIAAMLNSWSF